MIATYHRCDRCDRWEKKKTFSDRSDHSAHMKPLSCSDRSDRSENNRWDIKSSISAIVVTAIDGEWFPYDRWTFFLSDRSNHSDRSDHMEIGLNLSQ